MDLSLLSYLNVICIPEKALLRGLLNRYIYHDETKFENCVVTDYSYTFFAQVIHTYSHVRKFDNNLH